jgi:hypothetical protein
MNVLTEALTRTDRDKLAALLSFIPGAGHLLKGRKGLALGIMTMGNLAMVLVAGWLAAATDGASFVLMPLGWLLGVAVSAYVVEDHARAQTPARESMPEVTPQPTFP